tara:strand:- start:1044 stop:1472 length:429 start_codon:yes stop_codon:yes gene_type:complete
MTLNITFDQIQIGDQLPAWSRKTDFMNWNRYAAVNDEFVYIHMDDEVGKAALNEQGAFGMGNLRYTYMLNALRDWAGDEAIIKECGLQFRAINQKNDILTVTGKITNKQSQDGELLIFLEMNVINQAGESTTPGHAIVAIPE